MRHLTDDERAIRRSRGIPITRLLPFLLMIIAIVIMCSDQNLFQQCVGKPLEVHGRGSAWALFIVGVLCSPYYVRDFADHWLIIVAFCVGAGTAIPQIFWFKRHKAYWDTVRENERSKRAENGAEKNPRRGSSGSE